MKGLTPICQYCGKFSERATGKDLYPHRPDLYHLKFYRCLPCDAYVGTHEGTDTPLGRLANAELRKWKSKAHAAFDPLWKNGNMRRKEAYKQLGIAMNVEPNDCHIGLFSIEQCKQVIALCDEEKIFIPNEV